MDGVTQAYLTSQCPTCGYWVDGSDPKTGIGCAARFALMSCDAYAKERVIGWAVCIKFYDIDWSQLIFQQEIVGIVETNAVATLIRFGSGASLIWVDNREFEEFFQRL